jgi:hypothetical protein
VDLRSRVQLEIRIYILYLYSSVCYLKFIDIGMIRACWIPKLNKAFTQNISYEILGENYSVVHTVYYYIKKRKEFNTVDKHLKKTYV